MKNKKLLKVLSTSFILGTILMTNPTGAEKAEDLSVNENVENIKEDKDFKKETTTNVISENNVITGDSNTVKEKGKKLELVNDANSEKDSEKLELNSDTEKESVKADSGEIDPDLLTPNFKYDEPMKIDDPETYDYTKYMLDHYNPTNERFKEKGQQEAAIITDSFYDENGKSCSETALISKGKDFSNKIDEFIVELEKGRKENKLTEGYVDGLKNKIFNPGVNSKYFQMTVYYSAHLDTYLDLLSGMYMDTYNGKGTGHSAMSDGKMVDSDYTFENFKKTYEHLYNKDTPYVTFRISDSFKNRPIVHINDIFLSREQYLQDKDKILDYLKAKADFGKVAKRSTHIGLSNAWNNRNSEVLPDNIKNALAEEELKDLNNNGKFDIIYDKQHINHGG